MQPRSASLPAFTFLAWGLALHSLAMAVLFGGFGLPAGAVRVTAAWKELALALLLAVVVVRAILSRGPKSTLDWPDVAIGGLILFAVCYAIGQRDLLQAGLPADAAALGFRDAAYFMLLYFVGRGTPGLARDERTLRQLVYLIVVASVVALLELVLVSPETFVVVGVAAYFQDFLGVAPMTVGNEYGLPLSYWAVIGGTPVRRAGSFFLSGQGFAVPFILFFPAITVWTFMRPRRRIWHLAAWAIACTGLLLTLTRMTIVTALIQLLLFVLLLRKPEWAVAGMAAAAALFIIALVTLPGFPTFVWQTLVWQESSSATHVSGWTQGVVALAERPWGWGLGTADHTAIRLGLEPLTGDNLYLKYAVELGIVGVSLLCAVLVTVGRSAYRLFRAAENQQERRAAVVIWLAMVGLAINGMTGVVFNSVPMAWLTFWFAGAVVTVSQQRALATAAAYAHSGGELTVEFET